ncbi:MAG: hypothetical protein GY822_20805 [Deltaproteobacteria bacterium]|nr:hypothetical protein [Deltaproteobacteria bacterium]
MHPYQYVNQNPILFWDPDGMKEAETKVVIIGADTNKGRDHRHSRGTKNFRRAAENILSGTTSEHFKKDFDVKNDKLLVFMPIGSSKNMKRELRNNARELAKFLNHHGYENFEIRQVKNAGRLAKELSKEKNVTELWFFGHGGGRAPYFSGENWSQLPSASSFKINWAPNHTRKAFFYTCNSASYAKNWSAAHHALTMGTNGTTWFEDNRVEGRKSRTGSVVTGRTRLKTYEDGRYVSSRTVNDTGFMGLTWMTDSNRIEKNTDALGDDL